MCIKCGIIELSMKFDNLEPEVKRIAQLIYAGKLKPGEIDADMTKKIADQLMNGIFKGFGKNLTSKDLTSAERTCLTKLETNVYVFSGFKNYQQLKETTLLLKDDNGKLKSFSDFLSDVKQVNNTYNEVYLNAEYSNAVASAQTAATWNDYENNGIDMLTYRTAGDDRVREEHAILEGVTYPIDHEFWDTYYPPNDWGCRCDTEPAIGEKENPISKSELPDLPPMFQNNVGKSGVAFPDTHPYFDVNQADRKKILEQVSDILPLENTNNLVPANLGEYEKLLDVKIDKGIFDYQATPAEFTFEKTSGAYYDTKANVVNIPIDERRRISPWKAESTVYHEYGHAADFQNGYQKLDLVKDLMAKAKRFYKNDFSDLTYKLRSAVRESEAAKDFDKCEKLGAIQDTIMSLDKRYGSGHGYKVSYGGKKMDYFDVPGLKEAEFIAHAFENKFAGNEIFEEYMPGLYKEMINLVDKLKQ